MSTWIKEKTGKSWTQSLCENVLKCGSIPKHIAIIMDGNRRFAVKKKCTRSLGHLLGFNKISEALEWCSGLGVTEVTLYAFSLENFKRSQEEVDCLMELARQKFTAITNEKDQLMEQGMCVRFIGNPTYLPLDLQAILAEVVHLTKNNKKVFLNLCCAYTSQEEMVQAMKRMSDGVRGNHIVPSDIDENLFEECLYTADCSEPDLLIRTSGEVRLSDFLLWQTSHSVLSFTSALWPEFCKWHLYSLVLSYQLNYHHLLRARESRTTRRTRQRLEADTKVARQLLEQFPVEMQQEEDHDLDRLDDLIKKLQFNEGDDDVSFNTNSDPFPNLTSLPVSTTATTDSLVTPATSDHCSQKYFERLLVAVVASRQRRCGRFVATIKQQYNDYIDSVLKNNPCKGGGTRKNGIDSKSTKSTPSDQSGTYVKGGLEGKNGFKLHNGGGDHHQNLESLRC